MTVDTSQPPISTTTGTLPLPKEFKKYFWDCEFEQLRLADHSVFIAERILNFGNLPAVQWLLSILDRTILMDIVAKSRNLDKKTRNFWKLMLC